jgi:hypothetical protein
MAAIDPDKHLVFCTFQLTVTTEITKWKITSEISE